MMLMASDNIMRQSAQIAPLALHKARPQDNSADSGHRRNNLSHGSNNTKDSSSNPSQITPPASPNGSGEDLGRAMDTSEPVFHNYLRAFYPFHPTYAVTDTTVTLPLNEGDVILVHSIHTNGWADGTLLISGARGWLPTNYCEAYNPPWMRNLLKALLNFWDLLRSGLTTDSEVFGNQDFMRGIIAGVRYLLERSNCLTRESPIVQANELIRRNRKTLLSDLSGLVRTAKRLQEFAEAEPTEQEASEVNDIIDEMILKAFRIVTRGVRFLDTYEDDERSRHPVYQPVNRLMATVAEEAYVPPTPPADATSFEGPQQPESSFDATSHGGSTRSSTTGTAILLRSEEPTNHSSHKRMSTSYHAASRPLSMAAPATTQYKRNSISHRLSLTSSIPAAQRQHLISERLNATHDTLLSYLGSFIGRLHLQSQSSADLLSTVQQSVTAGQELLRVVEAVCARNNSSAESLEDARNAMYETINQLVLAAKDVVSSSSFENEDVVMAQQNGNLLEAATECVKAAGEFVGKTKSVIERIGDFDFEASTYGLGIDVATMGLDLMHPAVAQESNNLEEASDQLPIPEPSGRPPPPPLSIPSIDKPLPSVPEDTSPSVLDGPELPYSQPVHRATRDSGEPASATSSQAVRMSLLPPLPKMNSPLVSQDEYSPEQSSSARDSDHPSYRSGSTGVSSSATNSTYMSSMRSSEASMLSTASTAPDLAAFAPKHQPSMSDMSMTASQTLTDDHDDGEFRMLEKTYAHELLHNKEGHITGGTLPALVERLTTHDSTPDSMFVSTFYLTFRLFVTPTALAQALVDRFEYVSESPHIAGPVRLRVYNVFKGWLESHWRNLSDEAALSVIQPFAESQLRSVLPGAGRRLLELASKVSSTEGPLVPRQVSSMGKTSTSIAQYIPADTPLPAVNLSRSQINLLKNWKQGGSSPTILEFDPLELARQLTIKEMNIFCSIMPEELLGQEWTKRAGSNAVNVRAMSTLSTDLSNLVADTILHYEDVKKRAIIIKHWIKVAYKCLELNNYDSLLAIICSLNSSTIVRLKKTWDMVSQKRKDVLKALQTIVQPDKNHATLRKRLHNHVPPCLPFVGTYLTDLTFVDAGNPDLKQLPGSDDQASISVINFDKHTRTAKIIGELQRFQIPYRLAEVPELQEWLQAQIVRVKSSPEHENVQQYYRKSLLLEPREHHHPRPSPIDTTATLHGKEKFDMFSWTHSKERQGSITQAAPL